MVKLRNDVPALSVAFVLAGFLAGRALSRSPRFVGPPVDAQVATAPAPAELKGVNDQGTDAGSDATRPDAIPMRGWWHVARRAAAGFIEDRVMAEAAGITFYVLLALFPGIAGLISIYSLFTDTTQLSSQIDNLNGLIPQGGIDLIKTQLGALASSPHPALGVGAITGLLISLWSANAGVKSFFDALNVVYHEREKRGFIRLTLVSFTFTLATMAFLMVVLSGVVVVPVVISFFKLPGEIGNLVSLARWPLMLLIVTMGLAVLYRFGPSRRRAKWQWVSWGSAFAAIAWVGASFAFSYYVAHFGSYNKTYGSLGAAAGFMTWIWISSMVVLLGAEVNAELEQQTLRDTTVGREKPIGLRGAYEADVKL